MNVKISEMTSATSLDGTELVPIVQSGVSKKTSIADICNPLSVVVGQRSNNIHLSITTAWSAGQVTIPLESLYINYGNDYELTNDGTIKVGSKPKVVKITSQISPYGLTTGSHSFSCGIKRKRNGNVESLGRSRTSCSC